MKIRVTLMTENDAHVDASKEEIEAAARIAWTMFFNQFVNTCSSDKVAVEKCELIEE